MAKNPRNPKSGKEFVQVDNQYMADDFTGTTSATDYIYAVTTVDGYYEIVNSARTSVSSAMTNPNFPVWSDPTQVVMYMNATVNWNTINAASGLGASADPGSWTYTASNIQGGFEVTGNIFTTSAAELYIPVTQTAQTALGGTYKLPNGQHIQGQGLITTGRQQYAIMDQAGPWPTGIAANTSATVTPAMLPVWQDLGMLLSNAGMSGLQSLGSNWIPQPD